MYAHSGVVFRKVEPEVSFKSGYVGEWYISKAMENVNYDCTYIFAFAFK